MDVRPIGLGLERSSSNPKRMVNRIAIIGQTILKTLGHILLESAVWIGKALVASLFLTAALVSLTAVALSVLALPLTSGPFHRSVAFTHDMLTKIKIIYHYGRGEEIVEKADEALDSPQFMLITPTGPLSASTPILYAPGYLDDPQSLRVICRRLARQTGRKVYIVKYRSLFQSLEEHTQDVIRVGERIFKDHSGKRKLALIGHSMGGLSTGAALAEWPEPIDLKQWITIGSPLKGTRFAHIGYGKCARQMRPNSEFIAKFQTAYSKMDASVIFHVHAPSDHVVPAHSASTSGPNNHACHPIYGHVSMREAPEVENLIVDLLTSRKNRLS